MFHDLRGWMTIAGLRARTWWNRRRAAGSARVLEVSARTLIASPPAYIGYPLDVQRALARLWVVTYQARVELAFSGGSGLPSRASWPAMDAQARRLADLALQVVTTDGRNVLALDGRPPLVSPSFSQLAMGAGAARLDS